MGATKQGWDQVGSMSKRILLGIATSGTSEIKTGGGQYGDETVADSLFPKTVNNALLDERQGARAAKDAATQRLVDQAATNAALAPDALDAANGVARRQGARRLLQGAGRRNSFLGAM